MNAIRIPEMAAVKNGVAFITHFILQSRGHDRMTAAVLEKGDDIIRNTLNCIGVLTPRTQVDIFGDIFIAFNKKYPAELVVWIKILELDSFPTPQVSQQDKEQFMKSIIR